jgi:O-acetyl-ADP-ribose deacetylase (regulator of RNase III)
LKVKINNRLLELVSGDITELSTDAIINAANGALKLGGGVAGAIRTKGGPEIQMECNRIIAEKGRIPTGGAAITRGGNLKAKFIIHAVGPICGEGDEERKLRNATISSLKLADREHLKSIAFPAISTGHFGLPKERCAEVMIPTVISYLRSGTNLGHIIFCLYDQDTYDVFRRTLEKSI